MNKLAGYVKMVIARFNKNSASGIDGFDQAVEQIATHGKSSIAIAKASLSVLEVLQLAAEAAVKNKDCREELSNIGVNAYAFMKSSLTALHRIAATLPDDCTTRSLSDALSETERAIGAIKESQDSARAARFAGYIMKGDVWMTDDMDLCKKVVALLPKDVGEMYEELCKLEAADKDRHQEDQKEKEKEVSVDDVRKSIQQQIEWRKKDAEKKASKSK